MNTSPDVREHDIADAAVRLALAQPFIPESPGLTDASGDVALCAAACFAAAGLETAFGPDARLTFQQEIGRTNDKSVVYRAYEQLGWDSWSCAHKMEMNDASSVALRPALMRSLASSQLQ